MYESKNEMITLEEYLQKCYGLKGPLYRKRPLYDSENCPRWWTKKGLEAYGRFIDSLNYMNDFASTQLCGCEPLNDDEAQRLIRIIDNFEYECPGNG